MHTKHIIFKNVVRVKIHRETKMTPPISNIKTTEKTPKNQLQRIMTGTATSFPM